MNENKNAERWLSAQDVLNIPTKDLPLLVLSDNVRSFISWGIKAHESGMYNHLMLMIEPQLFATQNLMFCQEPVKNYLKKHRLKFWHNPYWTNKERQALIRKVKKDLAQPWYKRIYDVVAIVGQAIHCESLQIPGIDICSDKAAYLKVVDPLYNLKHPSPPDVNRWMQKQTRYQVYGRYAPD